MIISKMLDHIFSSQLDNLLLQLFLLFLQLSHLLFQLLISLLELHHSALQVLFVLIGFREFPLDFPLDLIAWAHLYFVCQQMDLWKYHCSLREGSGYQIG